jgi:hypothetical protein
VYLAEKEQTMKTFGSLFAVTAAIVAVGWLWPAPVEAASKVEHARAAVKLLEETLKREAREGIADRTELLKPAFELTPPDAVYWQCGFVFDAKRKEWLRSDEVQQFAAKDSRLAAYRKTREKTADTVDGQIELARWCVKRKLEDQARAHWTRVLELDPNNIEARQRLGFKAINGAWVNEGDIAEAQAKAQQASQAAAKWIPRLEKLRDQLNGDKTSQKEKARKELTALRDPDAVQAIDTVFCRQSLDTALLGVELLKNMPSAQAAGVLAGHAIYSPWPQVRLAAALALQSQEKYNYVPLLIEATQQLLAAQTQAAAANSKMCVVYRLDPTVSSYSWNTVERLKEHPQWYQVSNMRFDAKTPNRVAQNTTTTSMQGGSSVTTQKKEYYVVRDYRLQEKVTQNQVTTRGQKLTAVGAYPVYPKNSMTSPYPLQPASQYGSEAPGAQQSPPAGALSVATGATWPKTPDEWWGWWYDDNDVYVSSDKQPNAPNRPKPKPPAEGEIQAQRGDCLAPGTLVRAESGPTPIENIAIGDRVFCCDPETGSLVLKPVLRKTERPKGLLLKIHAGGQQLETSGGQVFWVSGQGWVKARDLRKGMRLHTLRGTVDVDSVEPGSQQSTYGLVVADYHTFFAGRQKILTHDNTIRKPTQRVVPGLAKNP